MATIDARIEGLTFLKDIPTITLDSELLLLSKTLEILCTEINTKYEDEPRNLLVFSYEKNTQTAENILYIKKQYKDFCGKRTVAPLIALRDYFLKEKSNGITPSSEYRTMLSWVVKEEVETKTPEGAQYIAIDHKDIPRYMEELFLFIDNSKQHALITLALIHYQFAAIHPFTDSNGRVNRALIFILLSYYKVLDVDIYILYTLFEKETSHYSDEIQEVHMTKDYIRWSKYFLTMIIRSMIDIRNAK